MVPGFDHCLATILDTATIKSILQKAPREHPAVHSHCAETSCPHLRTEYLRRPARSSMLSKLAVRSSVECWQMGFRSLVEASPEPSPSNQRIARPMRHAKADASLLPRSPCGRSPDVDELQRPRHPAVKPVPCKIMPAVPKNSCKTTARNRPATVRRWRTRSPAMRQDQGIVGEFRHDRADQ